MLEFPMNCYSVIYSDYCIYKNVNSVPSSLVNVIYDAVVEKEPSLFYYFCDVVSQRQRVAPPKDVQALKDVATCSIQRECDSGMVKTLLELGADVTDLALVYSIVNGDVESLGRFLAKGVALPYYLPMFIKTQQGVKLEALKRSMRHLLELWPPTPWVTINTAVLFDDVETIRSGDRLRISEPFLRYGLAHGSDELVRLISLELHLDHPEA